jgi:hypothetical protein
MSVQYILKYPVCGAKGSIALCTSAILVVIEKISIQVNMRKRLIPPISQTDSVSGQGWFELDRAALVEVPSEADAHPIEEALVSQGGKGWRAATPGVQTIRVLFDRPQTIRRIKLVFKEDRIPRTQEFVLRWCEGDGTSLKDIVRQQWNFSPPATANEYENYSVELLAVTTLELTIHPDISRGEAHASLESLQVGVQ